MSKFLYKKNSLYATLLILSGVFLYIFGTAFAFWGGSSKSLSFNNSQEKKIKLIDNGIYFGGIITKAETVSDFFREQKISVGENDWTMPNPDSELFSNAIIIIERAKKITVSADGKKVENYTLGNSVENALWDAKVNLGEDDLISPVRSSVIQDGQKIVITRVDIRQVKVKKDIDFETISQEDDKMSWRQKKIIQKGVKGIKEITYKVVSHDGKEISRKALDSTVIKDPTPEISTQGTYIKLGKAKTGQGTWYAFKGGLFAASTTLPRGAYAKVTNAENGKTVVVQINDYGPQGKGRIIDLDKVAFQKIADLGAGVIGVKVEQILN